jgi:SAM-dependent methyltransferase
MSDDAGTDDERNVIYKTLHSTQLSQEKPATEYSSQRVLEILFKCYRPNSLLDVGCGLGMWLKMATTLGVSEVRGIEGEWIDPALLEVSPDLVQVRDLEKGFDLKRKFDLVICLEVAEHLSEGAADNFIASLVRHAPAVLFSAAIPFQGGDHHVNERFLPYWAAKFAQHDYRPVDFIRRELWEDERALLWIRQNVMLFAHEGLIAGNELLRRAGLDNRFPFSVVHPEFYYRRAQDMERVYVQLRTGGFYHVKPIGNSGGFELAKVTDNVKDMERLRDLLKAGGFYYATAAKDDGGFTVVKADEKVEEMEKLQNYLQTGGLFKVTPGEPGNFRVEKAGGSVEELTRLRDYISDGGLFRVTRESSGRLNVTKADEPPETLEAAARTK